MPLSSSAARHRHRPREVQVRRRAIAMARSIAEAKANGTWASMQPRHQQLTLAMLRWYEAGAPIDREPSAHVPIEDWLAASPPEPPPSLPPPSPLVSLPYGLRVSCALSTETLEDRYREELERAACYHATQRHWSACSLAAARPIASPTATAFVPPSATVRPPPIHPPIPSLCRPSRHLVQSGCCRHTTSHRRWLC